MASLAQDIELPIDGPSFLGDWDGKERKRRRTAFRLLTQLSLIPFYLMALRLFDIPQLGLGVVASAAIAFVFVGLAPFALGEAHRHVHSLAYVAFGIITATLLRYLGRYDFGPVHPLAAPVGGAIGLWGWYVTTSFVGWCTAIPDRDVTERRKWRRLWHSWDCEPRPGPYLRSFLAAFYGYVCAMGGMGLLAVLSWPRWTGREAIVYYPPVVSLAIGTLVGLVTGRVTPAEMLRATCRAFVLFHTYDLPVPGQKRMPGFAVYTFPRPFRDHRIRALLTVTMVTLVSVFIITALGWPQTVSSAGFKEEVWLPFLWGKHSPIHDIALVLIGLTQAVFFAVFIFLWIFTLIAAWFGPFLALTYREFADGAVRLAERSSET